ncbi:uncharacterized protein LOC143146730 isoform X2 [Ptiloglossa arizonensis]|uniref:uncharacterized protein LOC143146730 isoform X2 n=1 Tax=Ptiloglossa arizonensis TaxID=3350558 RepID=UPI003FA0CFC7
MQLLHEYQLCLESTRRTEIQILGQTWTDLYSQLQIIIIYFLQNIYELLQNHLWLENVDMRTLAIKTLSFSTTPVSPAYILIIDTSSMGLYTFYVVWKTKYL